MSLLIIAWTVLALWERVSDMPTTLKCVLVWLAGKYATDVCNVTMSAVQYADWTSSSAVHVKFSAKSIQMRTWPFGKFSLSLFISLYWVDTRLTWPRKSSICCIKFSKNRSFSSLIWTWRHLYFPFSFTFFHSVYWTWSLCMSSATAKRISSSVIFLTTWSGFLFNLTPWLWMWT